MKTSCTTMRSRLAVAVRFASLSLLAPTIMVGSASAQQATGELNKVVVSAAGFEQKITDAPASVTVVTREDLQSKPYGSLADALRDVEGIDVGTSLDKNGNVSISMRGLPSDYTLVMVDGKRQSDIGDIGPNNFGNSQFMYMPPLAAIDRIEVVRGPMSTLYGADAMGGVINIITRKVPDVWSGSFTQSLTMQESSQFGDDKKTDLYVAGPLVEGLLGFAFRASLYDRDNSEPTFSDALPLPPLDAEGNQNDPMWYDQGSFGDRKIVEAQNWNVGGTLNWIVNENHDLALSYDIAKQRYDNTQGQTGTLDGVESLWRASNTGIVQPRVGYTKYQRVEREQISLTHNARFDFGSLETSYTRNSSSNLGRSLPLTVQERHQLQDIWDQAKSDQGLTAPRAAPVLTDPIRALLTDNFLPRQLRALDIDSDTFETRFDTSIGDAHALIIGAQYYDADMEDGVFGMDGAGFRDGTVQRHRQVAVYAEDHWAITDALTATLGARYDDHNIFGGNTSPRAYLAWATNDQWTFKGGISTGYKTPKPNQLFPGITGFGGQGVNPFVGTPNLQPETSTNYEVAAYFDSLQGFSANVTFFYNDFKDKIASSDGIPNCYGANDEIRFTEGCVDIGPGWGPLGYMTFGQSTNIDKVETAGVEIGSSYQITPSIKLRANYTYTDSEQKSGNNKGLPLVDTPKNMFNATLSWQVLEPLSVSLITEIRDDRYRSSVTNAATGERTNLYYKSYELLHLGARYKVNETVTFNARVNNLLDKNLSTRSCALNSLQNGYTCSADYKVTEQKRSLWLSADITF